MGNKSHIFQRRNFDVGAMLYSLTVVFPSWAGVFTLVYVLITYGLSALRMYFP